MSSLSCCGLGRCIAVDCSWGQGCSRGRRRYWDQWGAAHQGLGRSHTASTIHTLNSPYTLPTTLSTHSFIISPYTYIVFIYHHKPACPTQLSCVHIQLVAQQRYAQEMETKLNRADFFPSLQTVPHNHHLVHQKEKAWVLSSYECKLTEM